MANWSLTRHASLRESTAPTSRHRLVPEIVLDRPRIVASIGQGKAAGVPEHVGMDLQIGALS
jgi:hypothetical protein